MKVQSIQKKRIGHMKVQVFKEKKREKEIAHVQRKKWRERDGS